MKTLTPRYCTDKNCKSWWDTHFRDTPDNSLKMANYLTSIAVLGQCLCNLRGLCTTLGYLPPPRVPIDHPRGHGLVAWGGYFDTMTGPSLYSASGDREQVVDVSPALAMEQSSETVLRKLAQQAGLAQAPKA